MTALLARAAAALIASWGQREAAGVEAPVKVELDAAPPDRSGATERRLHLAVGGGARAEPFVRFAGGVMAWTVGSAAVQPNATLGIGLSWGPL